MGLVGSMGMTDNMMLKSYGKGHSPIVDRKAPLALAETIKKELGVVTPDLNTPVSRLSGGNVQKVLVGRELAADPIVLMTAYAVRGLDINTSYTIWRSFTSVRISTCCWSCVTASLCCAAARSTAFSMAARPRRRRSVCE